MKKVSEELRYDGASLAQVHEMLADPAFRERVCDRQHVLRHTVEIDSSGPGMTVKVDQVQAAQGIPGFAKKFVGDEINIVQTEDWTGPEKGNIHVAIPGKPGEMSGTAMLTEDPDGTTETVNLSVKVNIPLVGGKIEGLVADLLSKALRAEHETGVDWLAGNRS
jgi:hypothetical protein